jgi:hypothetical protein
LIQNYPILHDQVAGADFFCSGWRQVKVALIERVVALRSLDTPQVFGSLAQGIRFLATRHATTHQPS